MKYELATLYYRSGSYQMAVDYFKKTLASPDLDADTPAELMPMISDNWGVHFRWRGVGEISAADRAKLLEVVEKAHKHGRTVRFWNIPANAAIWGELSGAGVDRINTDGLAGLEKFLRERDAKQTLGK